MNDDLLTFYVVSFTTQEGPRLVQFRGRRTPNGIDQVDTVEINGEVGTRTRQWQGEAFETIAEAVAHRRGEMQKQLRRARREIEMLEAELVVTTVGKAKVLG